MADLDFGDQAARLVLANDVSLRLSHDRAWLEAQKMGMLRQVAGGVAHHFVDILFLFQTLRDIYPNELSKKVAEDMGRYWVSFAAKGKPDGWQEFNDGIVAVVDQMKGWVQKTEEEDRKTPWRRDDRWDLISKIQPYGQVWGDQMASRRDRFWK